MSNKCVIIVVRMFQTTVSKIMVEKSERETRPTYRQGNAPSSIK